jgi:LuxR family transcriptional regulator, maltose regulon positive regulatory protein
MASLLATKLHRPSTPPKLVQRPRLVKRLNEGLADGRQLTLVSAPAGFGKTTCISEWVNALDLPVSWLSLDAADDDPGRFFSYLVAALQKVDEALGREIESALHLAGGQLPPSEVISTTLINQILNCKIRFLLVLDDFHVIQDRLILQVLEKLVEGAMRAANPHPLLHLVLVTREDPALPLARIRAHNQMTEIRASDLRFSDLEADGFLNEMMGLCLSQADITVLQERTEGWIVGLQLAGLSVRDRADPSGYIASLSGSHRYILNYLTEEVLSRQPEEIQRFLLETSILEQMCGPLCDAVLEKSGAQATLEFLDRANLFVIALDDEQNWYRYHHLFAGLLANRLKQLLSVQAVQALHCRASEWLAQNEYLDEAVQHALAGKAYETAAALVEQTARTMMFTGRVNALKSWLDILPEATFNTHPRLGIYQTWVGLLTGKADLSEPALQEKDEQLRALPASPENDALRLEMMVILCRFVALAGNTARAIRTSQEALALLPEDDLGSRARVYSALAIAYGSEGGLEKAVPVYNECLRLAQASGNYSLAAHTITMMAMVQGYYGHLHEAVRDYQSIIDMGAMAGQKVFYPAGQGLIGLAGIYLEWNELEKAEECLKQGMELCHQAGLDGMYTGALLISRLRLARGNFEGALEELRLLEQALPRADTINLTVRLIQTRLWMGDTAEAVRLAQPLKIVLAGHPAIPRPPLLGLEIIEAILIRVYLAEGELPQTLQLLDALQATAEPGNRFGRLIEVHLLRALALQKQNGGNILAAALEQFERALELAEPEGYCLLFLEEGPAVIPLLKAVLSQKTAPERLKKYAGRLLQAFGGEDISQVLSVEEPDPNLELIEPLTERELEVLHLMAGGLKYGEIAGSLFISLNTVRSYIKGIYGKLGVNNRTQAIALAQKQRLI